jgi:hypothetical protein
LYYIYISEQFGSVVPETGPDDIEDRLNELRGDRRFFLGFMTVGLTLLGAGAVGAYSLIIGDHIPIVGSIIPGTGALTSGVGLTVPSVIGSVRKSREIHELSQ